MRFLSKPNRKAKVYDALAVTLLFVLMAALGCVTLLLSVPTLGWLR